MWTGKYSCYNQSLGDVVLQILWWFLSIWRADISGISQVNNEGFIQRKTCRQIWYSCSPNIPTGFWTKILWSKGFTKFLESHLHVSQRKSYLSARFFFSFTLWMTCKMSLIHALIYTMNRTTKSAIYVMHLPIIE